MEEWISALKALNAQSQSCCSVCVSCGNALLSAYLFILHCVCRLSLQSGHCWTLTSPHCLACKCWPSLAASTWLQLSTWLSTWSGKRWWPATGTAYLKVSYLIFWDVLFVLCSPVKGVIDRVICVLMFVVSRLFTHGCCIIIANPSERVPRWRPLFVCSVFLTGSPTILSQVKTMRTQSSCTTWMRAFMAHSAASSWETPSLPRQCTRLVGLHPRASTPFRTEWGGSSCFGKSGSCNMSIPG